MTTILPIMSGLENHQLARGILSYLVTHPNAQDTLEGIAEWWLLEETIASNTKDVQETLSFLVHRGWLQRISRGHSGDCYRVNDDKRDEITSLLHSNSLGI